MDTTKLNMHLPYSIKYDFKQRNTWKPLPTFIVFIKTLFDIGTKENFKFASKN